MERAAVVLFILRGPGLMPEPGPSLEVSAPTSDGLRDAAREAIKERGLALRAISFGPTGLVAYAEAPR